MKMLLRGVWKVEEDLWWEWQLTLRELGFVYVRERIYEVTAV
jgi:hypothetical protein